MTSRSVTAMRLKILKVGTAISVVVLVLIIYLYNRRPPAELSTDPALPQYHVKDIHAPLLDVIYKGHRWAYDLSLPELPYKWYVEHCFSNSESKDGRSIWDIYNKLKELRVSPVNACSKVANLFDMLFRFDESIGQLVLPKPFKAQVSKWLGNNAELLNRISHNQKIYKISNKWTFEESIYNPLRSKRPTTKDNTDQMGYIENISLSTSNSCDFCSYKEHTAADIFGRVDNQFSASASNTFKLAKFHGLFFPKSHHPLNLNYSVIADIFVNTSQQWFQKANENDPKQIYPTVLWDSLPHSGASQVHPHVHGLLGEYQYAGLMESMHNVAEQYYSTHKRSYWTDTVLVHWALGLAINKSQTVLIVPLNPRKDHEYMIISPSVNEDAVKLLYRVLQNYKNNLKLYCWSGAAAYPVMDESKSGLPMIYRIGSRGVCTTIVSDVSSLELYTVNNINTDLEKTYLSLLNTTDF